MDITSRNLPDINRLSVVTAMILLAYAVTPFVDIQEGIFTITLPGMVFPIQVTVVNAVSFLAAAMAGVGSGWLLQTHPAGARQPTWQHWFLPALTAWVIGVPLNSLRVGVEWWAMFLLGGVLLVLIFLAEYIVVDLMDARHAPATAGLMAVSFGLYLFLAIAVRAGGLRLFMALPALAIPLWLVVQRTLYLRLGGRWCFAWSTGITLLVMQVMVGLHYLPVPPVSFGLFLAGPAYALTAMAALAEEGNSWRTLWIEPLLMLLVFVLLGILIWQ